MSTMGVVFQVAFDSQPGDAAYDWTAVPSAQAMAYARGAPNEYGQMETGQSEIQVGDPDSDLDPNNTNSKYYPNVKRGKPIRATLLLGNLLMDSGFEDPDITFQQGSPGFNIQPHKWVAWGGNPSFPCAVSRVTSEHVDAESKASLQVSPSRTDGGLDGAYMLRPYSPDTPFAASAWVKAPVGAQFWFGLDWFTSYEEDTSATFISSNYPVSAYTGTGDWQHVSITGTSPTGTRGVDIGVYIVTSAGDDTFYLDNVKLEVGTAVTAWEEGMYPLFQHFIERLPRSQRVGQVWTQRTLTGVDAFGSFALAGLKGQSYGAADTGTRWWDVFESIGWPESRRDIDLGNSDLEAITFADDSDERALSHLLTVVDNENGLGFMNATGKARFLSRHSMIANTTVQAIFADDASIEEGSWPTALRFTGLAPESTDVVNDYTGKRASGTTQTASDAASIADYGPRSQELTFQVDSDNVVLDAINWRLSRTKDPHERVDSITVMPGTDPDKWVTLVGLEVGDNVTVVEWPPGYPAPVETNYVIRHLAVKLPTALSGTEFTFQLTPSSVDNWLVLDDAVFGKLDENKLAY